ncbi:hypothetical protein [Paracoccus simplex]|uniref:Uncharacterized protein n=1 Tax=Paracoccus simplex TaxID=2086346 RepID=A0ABV7RW95_9RHOB
MSASRPRFIEGAGGAIIDRHTGRELARVPVEKLTITEAQRICRAIMVSLETEFSRDPQSNRPPLPKG